MHLHYSSKNVPLTLEQLKSNYEWTTEAIRLVSHPVPTEEQVKNILESVLHTFTETVKLINSLTSHGNKFTEIEDSVWHLSRAIEDYRDKIMSLDMLGRSYSKARKFFDNIQNAMISIQFHNIESLINASKTLRIGNIKSRSKFANNFRKSLTYNGSEYSKGTYTVVGLCNADSLNGLGLSQYEQITVKGVFDEFAVLGVNGGEIVTSKETLNNYIFVRPNNAELYKKSENLIEHISEMLSLTRGQAISYIDDESKSGELVHVVLPLLADDSEV